MKHSNRWTVALAAAGVISANSLHAADASNPIYTQVAPTTISGYVDTSAIWKTGTGTTVVGRAFDTSSRMDGFNLEVVSLNLGRPVENSGWSAGYNANLLFGPNARGFNKSVGLPLDDISLMDAYVALNIPVGNGLIAKLGTFDKILGYEAFHSPLNPHFSRSYGFVLGPGQNTGAQFIYEVCSGFSVTAAIADAHTGGINQRSSDAPGTFFRTPSAESQKAYMAALNFTLPESAGWAKGSKLSIGINDGLYGQGGAGNTQDTTSIYAGVTLNTPVQGLTVGSAFDYRNDGPNGVTSGENWAWAASVYLGFQATDKLKLTTRAEYTTGSDGTYFDGGALALSDKQNKLGGLTFTADYSLWANVISRAEMRWDHSFSSDRPFGISDRNAVQLALNLVYRF